MTISWSDYSRNVLKNFTNINILLKLIFINSSEARDLSFLLIAVSSLECISCKSLFFACRLSSLNATHFSAICSSKRHRLAAELVTTCPLCSQSYLLHQSCLVQLDASLQSSVMLSSWLLIMLEWTIQLAAQWQTNRKAHVSFQLLSKKKYQSV